MILTPPERHWVCPNCTTASVTRRAEAHTQMHQCPGLRGLLAPMVEDGRRAHVVALEREDYVGGEKGLRYADAVPIMATHVLRDDGSFDAFVYPAAATISVEG